MCLGAQNDHEGSRQQSVEKGGSVVQVQSQKGTVRLRVWDLRRDGAVIKISCLRTLREKMHSPKKKKKKPRPREQQVWKHHHMMPLITALSPGLAIKGWISHYLPKLLFPYSSFSQKRTVYPR